MVLKIRFLCLVMMTCGGAAYTESPMPFQTETSALIAHLSDVSFPFDQLYDKLIDPSSDVRVVKNGINAILGTCKVDAAASKPSTVITSQKWGYGAYNYVCTGDSVYDWADKPYQHTKARITMVNSVDNSDNDFKVCEFVICYKADDAKVTAGSLASPNYATFMLKAEDIDPQYHAYLGMITIRYTVDCGIRRKITVCPLVDGTNQGCVVKKVCAAHSDPEPAPNPSHTERTVAYYYGEGTTEAKLGKATTEANGNALWNALTDTTGFKIHLAQTCASPCGFF